jgi:hypothetical protein
MALACLIFLHTISHHLHLAPTLAFLFIRLIIHFSFLPPFSLRCSALSFLPPVPLPFQRFTLSLNALFQEISEFNQAMP